MTNALLNHLLADQEKGPDLPPLADVIERIGLGKTQLRTGLLGGGVWLCCGCALLLVSSVAPAISEELRLQAWQRGSLVSAVFLGALAGNTVSGPVGDGHGRRTPILVSFVGIAAFSVASAFVYSYEALFAVRLFLGASMGLGQPAFNTLCSEVAPAHWRILMNSACQSLFIAGEIYAVSLMWADDPSMTQMHWRRLVALGAVPAAIAGVLANFLLLESPSYLAVQGDYHGAKQVLEAMGADNRRVGMSVDFEAVPRRASSSSVTSSVIEPMGIIFSRKLLYSSLTVLYSCFSLNIVYFGVLYAMPSVVASVDMGHSPAASLMIGAFYELPGNVIAVVCGMLLPRKPVMITYLAAVSLSLVAFASGAADSTGAMWWSPYLLEAGFMGIKTFAGVGFVVVYLYITEIYPTRARTTGSAACMAGGRVGGMLAPLVFEWLLKLSGSFLLFFQLAAALCVVNIFLILFLPIETFGKSLQDDDIDEASSYPTSSSSSSPSSDSPC